METDQQTRERLENIRGVEPIVNALRTIAMGNWKTALARRKRALEFDRQIGGLLAGILAALPPAGPGSERAAARVTALAVGSERGLCGAFNRLLAEKTARYLERAAGRGERVRLQAAGTSAARALERMGIHAELLKAESASALPVLALADALARGWLAAYEADETDRVDVLYNAYLGAGRFKPRARRLIPPFVSPPPEADRAAVPFPPILQTDPAALVARIAEQRIAARLYACLLESSAAENSVRFQLMEDARQNINRLAEELEADAAQARRQAITREILNLAAGSGLLWERH